jgi:DUF2892 family protein
MNMTVDRMVLIIAGTFILASVALAHYHSPYWLFFTVFVGLNLLQAGFSKWCLMAKILAKLGIKKGVAFE